MSWYKIFIQILAAVTADAIICCICLFNLLPLQKGNKGTGNERKNVSNREKLNVSESWHITSTKYNSEWHCVYGTWKIKKLINKQ